MAIQKQSVNVNFASGLDTKTDPFQVTTGKFLSLQNSIFQKGGALQKRNGFGQLSVMPSMDSTFLTIFNGNLTAIGTSLQSYSQSNATWVNKGAIQPVSLNTISIIKNNTNQSQVDTAVAANGLVCTVYTDNVPSGGSNVAIYKYAILDSITGQNIVAPTVITTTLGTVVGSPRVFVLNRYFVIVFTNLISATYNLDYITISLVDPTQVSANTSLSAQYTPSTRVNFDGIVANNTLYLAWNGNDGGGAIRMRSLSSTLVLSGTKIFAGKVATIMSVTADTTGVTPVIYASFYNSGTSTGYTLAVNQILGTVLAPTLTIPSGTVLNITSSAQNAVNTIYYEVSNTYAYDSGIATNYVKTRTITQSGALGTAAILVRSVGLASKSFIVNSQQYFLAIYSSPFQPSYFLINNQGKVISKLAYSNGGSYYDLGLPSASIFGTTVNIGYFLKDQIQAVNKTQGATNTAGVYTQVGINLASFTIGNNTLVSAEIGANLNISGGFLWAFDGYSVVENGFFLWPDYVETTPSSSGGTMTTQQYFYIATYEWSDNQGNVFRSAPSIPIGALTTSDTSSVTIDVPTLRLTYKTANPVKIVLYRWSTGQQTYFQATSIIIPNLNSLAVDYLAIVDTLPDSAIAGNNILYTTGGVIENISPPATDVVALFQSRLFLVDAEDKNLLWFSKQVIEATPVEMSDLLTIYVAPTLSAQGNTGSLEALSALDDKLILFKRDAIYYINGTGPDNTGANSQFSDPIFITATVGCDNQNSIVFMPSGLMFQSDKGIWLLGRNLSTDYIGAPVEAYTTNARVLSAVNVPATNQIRFIMDSGVMLMYDYYYNQWGTFTNVPAISSTLYQNLHTYLDKLDRVFQETPGAYLDGAKPVLMNFTTSWFNLAGLQGYERAYFFYLLGTYITPHKLTLSIAYDYNPSPTQTSIITPDNFTPPWGGLAQWGSSPSWGGNSSVEQWRVFLKQQKCESFQINMAESFDSTMSMNPPGAGLTLSGLDLVVGLKSNYPRLKAARSVG